MQKFEIFRTGLLKFLEAGYLYIGMDHFAKPEDELAISQRKRTLHRNFQGYTTKAGADLLWHGGDGDQRDTKCFTRRITASSPHGRSRSANAGLPPCAAYRLSEDDRLRRAIISRLLCHTVLLKDEIAREFGIDFDRYFADELARLEASREDGLVFARTRRDSHHMAGANLYSKFGYGLRSLPREQQLAAKPLFSKTL